MADPRFYRNRGPLELAAICAKIGIALPPGADGAARVLDLASLEGASPAHLSFFSGAREPVEAFFRSRAGFVLVPIEMEITRARDGMVLLPTTSVPKAIAAIAALFYPDNFAMPVLAGVDPSAGLGRDVRLGPGVTIGAMVEIGDRTRIGAGTVIGPGVTIGHDCEIGNTVAISHAHLGDRVIVLPGTQIGRSVPPLSETGIAGAVQLGRVIVQDGAEIGAAAVLDRGTLGDTVIGEGTRVEGLVVIGPGARIGRHSVLAAPVAAGSVIADFNGSGGQDSGRVPVKPI